MNYEIMQMPSGDLEVVTHLRARRGRGVLFATAPLVVHLLMIVALFALASRDLRYVEAGKALGRAAVWVALALAAACFALGYRVRTTLSIGKAGIRLSETPAIGRVRARELAYSELRAWALDASIRSLGADVQLTAVHHDGRRDHLLEGDAHSGQLLALAKRLSEVSGVPLEPPKFTAPQTAPG